MHCARAFYVKNRARSPVVRLLLLQIFYNYENKDLKGFQQIILILLTNQQHSFNQKTILCIYAIIVLLP